MRKVRRYQERIFAVKFTDEDGVITDGYVTGRVIDYSELYGEITVTITNESGDELTTLTVKAQEKAVEPTVPVEPEQPEQPDEPTVPERTRRTRRAYRSRTT